MKKLLCVLCVAISFFATSCTEKADPDVLLLNSTTINVSKSEQVQILNFTASTDWTISSDQPWVSFDKSSGTKGDATVRMTVAANDTYETRTAKVKITFGSKSTDYVVVQSAVSEFGSSIVYTVNSAEQDFAVALKTNVAYDVVVEESAQSWISVLTKATKAAPVEKEVVLHVYSNSGLSPRIGKFKIVGDGISQEYVLIQQADYKPAEEVSAMYIGNVQKIYDSENWVYTTFRQYVLTLTSDFDKATLVLNAAEDTDPTVVPSGTYTVDASGTHESNTFSLRSLGGSEKYYTGLSVAEHEIKIEDGEITVAKEGDTYTVTAILIDAVGVPHRYSYQGTLTVEDKSFGVNTNNVSILKDYNTYFASKAYEWNLGLYISTKGTNSEYMSFAQFTVYTDKTDAVDAFPVGTFTFAEPETISSAYANGITDAKPNTFTFVGNLLDQRSCVVNSKGASLKLSRNEDGTYRIEFTAGFDLYDYDADYNFVNTGKSFDYSAVYDNVVLPAPKFGGLVPMEDGDFEIKSGGFNPTLGGQCYGNPFETQGGTGSLVLYGNTTVNENYSLQMPLYIDSSKWQFVGNVRSNTSSLPIPDGVYTFSTTLQTGSILPVKYNGANYAKIVNSYTGTTFYITGGTYTLKSGVNTFDLTAEYGGGKTIHVTGGFPYQPGYIRLSKSPAFTL